MLQKEIALGFESPSLPPCMTSLLTIGVARAAKMIVRTRFPYLRLTLSPGTPITTPCPIRLDQFSGLRSPSIVGISSDTVG